MDMLTLINVCLLIILIAFASFAFVKIQLNNGLGTVIGAVIAVIVLVLGFGAVPIKHTPYQHNFKLNQLNQYVRVNATQGNKRSISFKSNDQDETITYDNQTKIAYHHTNKNPKIVLTGRQITSYFGVTEPIFSGKIDVYTPDTNKEK